MSHFKHSASSSDRIATVAVIIAVVAVLGTIAVDARSGVSMVDSGARIPEHCSEPGGGHDSAKTVLFARAIQGVQM